MTSLWSHSMTFSQGSRDLIDLGEFHVECSPGNQKQRVKAGLGSHSRYHIGRLMARWSPLQAGPGIQVAPAAGLCVGHPALFPH